MNKKIIVVGTSGSGKSTFARQLSIKLNIPHIELDNLYWEKNWSINPNFRDLLTERLKTPQWVVCGNYLKVKDLTYQANIIIWLDYPFYLVFWRALKRSIHRLYTQEKICGENTETIKRLFSRNSILWWVIRTYSKRRKEYQLLFSQDNQLLKMIRVKFSKDLQEIMRLLTK